MTIKVIKKPKHSTLSDMPSSTNDDHDGRYYTETEINSNTLASSGASLVGLPSLDATPATLRTFIDGVSSSLYYSGGVITENSALDGTIDISECLGAIKLTTTDETMASFTAPAVVSQAVVAGINYICVDLNTDTPIFTVIQIVPNHSTVFTLGRVYKDAHDHLHLMQGGHEFTDMAWKTHQRFFNVDGLVRASGLITTESGGEDLALAITIGEFYRGVHDYTFPAFDSGNNTYDITGGGTGGTISANNTIVFDSGEGDICAEFGHGSLIYIDSSSNTNDGVYHEQSCSFDGTNTILIIEETTLNTGDDTGHVHEHVFRYWHYDFSTTSWVQETQSGAEGSIIIDVNYWNDIDNATEFQTFTSNRYGTAWVYAGTDGDVHVVYGQGDYTLAQATAQGPPSSLPDIINEMTFLIAKIQFQEGDTSFYSVLYPWTSTFTATGAADHNGLANLDLAASGVTYGHIDDQAQTIAGAKTVTSVLTIDQDADAIGLNIDSEATTTTNYGLQVVTGQGASAGYFTYGNPAWGSCLLAENPNNSLTASFSFLRNLSAANTDCPVMHIHQENAGDDQVALTIVQAGTGLAIAATGNIDISGHSAFGASGSVDIFSITNTVETYTQTTGERYGHYTNAQHSPSGALSALSIIVGDYTQAHYLSDEDGSTYSYVYGTKSQAIGKSGSSGAINFLIGVLGEARSSTTGVVTNAIGVQGNINNNDAGGETGDITNAYSFLASGWTDRGTGTIAIRCGVYVEDVTGGGLLTNQYGIYCPALSGASGDNLFIKNVSADSDFGSGDLTTTGTVTAGAVTSQDRDVLRYILLNG